MPMVERDLETSTDKFWNERFGRYFENTLLDTFKPENAVRCKDRFGDEGWIVGYHDRIVFPDGCHDKSVEPWYWIIRDRDNALVGIHKEFLSLVPLRHS
jgi:hypothetical protein